MYSNPLAYQGYGETFGSKTLDNNQGSTLTASRYLQLSKNSEPWVNGWTSITRQRAYFKNDQSRGIRLRAYKYYQQGSSSSQFTVYRLANVRAGTDCEARAFTFNKFGKSKRISNGDFLPSFCTQQEFCLINTRIISCGNIFDLATTIR